MDSRNTACIEIQYAFKLQYSYIKERKVLRNSNVVSYNTGIVCIAATYLNVRLAEVKYTLKRVQDWKGVLAFMCKRQNLVKEVFL